MATRRCGVMAPLNGVGGAVPAGTVGGASTSMGVRLPIMARGLGKLRATSARPTRPRLRVSSPTARRLRTWRRASLPGLRSTSVRAWRMISGAEGTGSGFHRSITPASSSSISRSSSGASSNMIDMNSAPEAPSTVAWWILVRMAKRSSARPSMT